MDGRECLDAGAFQYRSTERFSGRQIDPVYPSDETLERLTAGIG